MQNNIQVFSVEDPMLDIALSYTARNWPVFPCRAADEEFIDEDGIIEILATKTPLTSNGFRGATLNERIVRELWRRNPGAMIGVPTGAPIGAWVLDIDPKHGGPDPLAALETDHSGMTLQVYAAAKRWEREVGGTVWNGWPVLSDRESQSKIIAEAVAIEKGERADGDPWKFADGEFRPLTNEQMDDLAAAVRLHVRNSYGIEAQVLAAIEAGSITTEAQIDAAFASLSL